MAYEVMVSPRAQLEVEEALEYYMIRSASVTLNFLAELERTYQTLAQHPFFRICYKNVRS